MTDPLRSSLPASPRFRRLRRSAALRELVAEIRLDPARFVLPLFLVPGRGQRLPVASMPCVFQLSPDEAIREIEAALAEGICACLLFGVVPADQKDERGNAALDPENVVCETLRLLRGKNLPVVAITDLCFCEYTSHGHCGPLAGIGRDGFRTVDNDATVGLLARQAVNHARAGADVVAPSGMMDGMVSGIRAGLDAAGFTDTAILSYAVKYASAFYGPFRDAAGSAPSFGDRRSYQMDFRRRREAVAEAAADVAQGADIIMVKPGMPCLDLLRDLRERLDAPLAAYQVSGEYAMIKAASANGWLDGRAAMLESLVAFHRAGADFVLTYFAREAARALREGEP
ncbi:MAG: porphobilinogen synthase [Verrucomicrobiae bacterium]|nr:porphobilinogen synthase [Verrucomicrobiae bacterium]